MSSTEVVRVPHRCIGLKTHKYGQRKTPHSRSEQGVEVVLVKLLRVAREFERRRSVDDRYCPAFKLPALITASRASSSANSARKNVFAAFIVRHVCAQCIGAQTVEFLMRAISVDTLYMCFPLVDKMIDNVSSHMYMQKKRGISAFVQKRCCVP